LKEIENQGKFKENAFNKISNEKVNFFHLGPKNNWENILDKDIKEEIENKLRKEMQELGYLF
tara:strand:- start:99 stop:284 length:186 start_codon:yes stop_codon:yes gene_type:complete